MECDDLRPEKIEEKLKIIQSDVTDRRPVEQILADSECGVKWKKDSCRACPRVCGACTPKEEIEKRSAALALG